MANFRLATIRPEFYAETVARTGSSEILDKVWRSYVGLYNEVENWYLPLRASINPKAPAETYYLTPFVSNSPHFKRPGIDFQKALYVPDDMILSIKNTLPKAQYTFIKQHFDDIQQRFERFVLSTEVMNPASKIYKFSTVPFFPEGIEKIKKMSNEALLEQSLKQIQAINLEYVEFYSPHFLDVFDLKTLTDAELLSLMQRLITQMESTVSEIVSMAADDPDLSYWKADFEAEEVSYQCLQEVFTERRFKAPERINLFEPSQDLEHFKMALNNHLNGVKPFFKSTLTQESYTLLNQEQTKNNRR
jgi:hypothetical protein